MARIIMLTVLLAAMSQVVQGSVVPAGPAYPAPGGNSFSFVGDPGDPGGRDVTYSAFDVVTPGLTGLWQGLWDPTSATAALDGSPDTLSFSTVAGLTGTWTGTTSWTDPDTSTFHASVPIKMDITITAGPVAWDTLPIAGLAFDPGLGAVIDNSAGANYTINVQFTADTGAGYVPINTIHQGTGGNTLGSVSLGFYSTVPEPSTLVLAAFGLAAATGCGFARRRRRA
ncbi:MAG TPA: PEP-CTERM sorting domain-containing protein [Pirellulales bacterium]|nr:PEP-CTERM sorting domain-containing protein [Pirellulales bacterium]